MQRPPKAIIGVGNALMQDEGVGIHAIAHLKSLSWPADVEAIDAGTPGLSMLHMIEGRSLAIIVDCADFGATPGEIGIFDPGELKRDEQAVVSLHACDLLNCLELGRQLSLLPKAVRIVGVQPSSIGPGLELSPIVYSALPKIASAIQGLLNIM